RSASVRMRARTSASSAGIRIQSWRQLSDSGGGAPASTSNRRGTPSRSSRSTSPACSGQESTTTSRCSFDQRRRVGVFAATALLVARLALADYRLYAIYTAMRRNHDAIVATDCCDVSRRSGNRDVMRLRTYVSVLFALLQTVHGAVR